MLRAGTALSVAVTIGLAASSPAHAAFPGQNGRIACSGSLAEPVSASGSTLELFDINPDCTDERRLMNNETSDFNPRYSADGKKIVFVKDNQVWTANADGTDERGPLTGPSAVAPAVASGGASTFVGGWSPDGSKITFLSTRDGNFEVYTMNADGSNPTNLSNNPPPMGGPASRGSDSQPAWSPDGTRIAFQSGRGGNPGIYTMNPDGSGVTAVTTGASEESAPSWSPDGKQLVFHSDQDAPTRTNATGRNLEIYRTNSDGTGQATRLTFSDFSGGGPAAAPDLDLTGFDLFPAWSPEGDRIVFHSGRAQENRDTGSAGIIAQWDVYTIDAVKGEGIGGDLRRLTNRAGNDERCDWQALAPATPVPAPDPTPTPTPTPDDNGERPLPNLIRPDVAVAVQPRGRSRSSARVSQSGGRIVVRLRGRMLGNRGQTCGGRLKIGTRAGSQRVASRNARMGSNCRYSARYTFSVRRLPRRLRPRARTLVLRVVLRFQGNSVLRGDLSPPKRIKVRR